MPINDNNPERRNLTVLSMSIIAFYVGEGSLSEQGKLSLPLINVSINNIHGLEFLVWVMLAWFCFRFWVETKQLAKVSFSQAYDGKNYFLSFFNKKFLRRIPKEYVEYAGAPTYRFFNVSSDSKKKIGLFVNYKIAAERSSNSIIRGTRESQAKVYIFRDFHVISLLFLRLFFDRPELSAYFSPYAMAVVAILLGMYNSFPCYICRLIQ